MRALTGPRRGVKWHALQLVRRKGFYSATIVRTVIHIANRTITDMITDISVWMPAEVMRHRDSRPVRRASRFALKRLRKSVSGPETDPTADRTIAECVGAFLWQINIGHRDHLSKSASSSKSAGSDCESFDLKRIYQNWDSNVGIRTLGFKTVLPGCPTSISSLHFQAPVEWPNKAKAFDRSFRQTFDSMNCRRIRTSHRAFVESF